MSVYGLMKLVLDSVRINLESPSPVMCQYGLRVVVYGISESKRMFNQINQLPESSFWGLLLETAAWTDLKTHMLCMYAKPSIYHIVSWTSNN